ncbi:MAG TPA: tRNA pseudouridine(55) synthase TruB [Gemmatimonadaceae bacterium]|nr:tRNA pseudouridine(55) synthase TruB [Gemmatimonadaceae bacterium]
MASPARDGLLLVDKPAGMTSHDVVDRARRALRTKRVGHAGTLDPFATGLLVLLVGRATRLLPYIDGEPKVYDATIRFGAETNTDDLTGEVTRTAPAAAHDAVERALGALTGEIDQLPPAFSAKQVGGQRAYVAARRGEALELAPVRVRVHSWALRGWEGDDLRARIVCGGGTYIRALARDLGRATGSAAHLVALRRVASGRFDVGDAVSADGISEAALRPAVDALPTVPRVRMDDAARARIGRGMTIARDASDAGEIAALLDSAGELVAIAARDGDAWQPRVVLVDG